jgi:hypothetical protein
MSNRSPTNTLHPNPVLQALSADIACSLATAACKGEVGTVHIRYLTILEVWISPIIVRL